MKSTPIFTLLAVSSIEAQGFQVLKLTSSYKLYNGNSDLVHSVLAGKQQITLHQMGMPVTLGIYMCYYYGLDHLGQMSWGCKIGFAP